MINARRAGSVALASSSAQYGQRSPVLVSTITMGASRRRDHPTSVMGAAPVLARSRPGTWASSIEPGREAVGRVPLRRVDRSARRVAGHGLGGEVHPQPGGGAGVRGEPVVGERQQALRTGDRIAPGNGRCGRSGGTGGWSAGETGTGGDRGESGPCGSGPGAGVKSRPGLQGGVRVGPRGYGRHRRHGQHEARHHHAQAHAAPSANLTYEDLQVTSRSRPQDGPPVNGTAEIRFKRCPPQMPDVTEARGQNDVLTGIRSPQMSDVGEARDHNDSSQTPDIGEARDHNEVPTNARRQ